MNEVMVCFDTAQSTNEKYVKFYYEADKAETITKQTIPMFDVLQSHCEDELLRPQQLLKIRHNARAYRAGRRRKDHR